MNEIYLRYQFKKLQYINLLLAAELLIYEGILANWYRESLAFNHIVIGCFIIGLLMIYAVSHFEVLIDYYPLIVMSLSGVIVLVVYFYYYNFSHEVTKPFFQVLILFSFLMTVSRERIYHNISLVTILLTLLLATITPSPYHIKVMHISMNAIAVIFYYIQTKVFSNLNRAYYELYSFQKKLIENIDDAYALHEAMWNDEKTKIIDYRYLSVNDAFEKMTSMKAHEVIGKKIEEVMPQTKAHLLGAFSGALLKKKGYSFVNYSQEFSKYFKINVYPVDNNKVATLFVDVTKSIESEKEIKERMKDAQRANEFKRQFLKDVNHKLRTPLNGMLGMAQLIGEEELSDEVRELFGYMLKEMYNTKNIISQISEYIDLKDETYQITENNLEQDINLVLEKFKDEGTKMEVLYKYQDIKGLFYEKNVFTKVLGALVSNGIKHSLSNKIIVEIKMTMTDGNYGKYLEVAVIDYGKGLDEEEQKMIFNQLHHQDFINIYREKGHMSLPLCKALMSHIGGDLTCESNEPKGLVFTIHMPIFDKIKK